MQDSRQKQFAMDAVEENRDNIALLGDNIFYFAELGRQDFLTEILRETLNNYLCSS